MSVTKGSVRRVVLVRDISFGFSIVCIYIMYSIDMTSYK